MIHLTATPRTRNDVLPILKRIAVAATVLVLGTPVVGQSAEDPLESILRPVVRNSVAVLLEDYHRNRLYKTADFPMDTTRFEMFRKRLVGQLIESLQLEEWVVENSASKRNALEGRFNDRFLKTLEHHGIQMEVHLIEIPETGDAVPAVLCLPEGTGQAPGVCVFSGHSNHGLRDLAIDLESYQKGIATRLAQAGFATIAVEKIDAGYLSRSFPSGNDEKDIATHRLAQGRVTRSHQLMACLAACEILATHHRVDEKRIGATGVSLGGWLSVQTALLTNRIGAIADFGVKTLHIPPNTAEADFREIADLCHILPGMLSVCDRNLIPLAFCPRPMLAGHGELDIESNEQSPTHYEGVFKQQYAELGCSENYAYHVHPDGDTMPVEAVVNFFQQALLR